MAGFRLDPRLRGRVDPADVVQEAYLEASEHRESYFRQLPAPLFLWLRGIVGNTLLAVHRRHLGVAMRDVGREAGAPCGGPPSPFDATSVGMVDQLSDQATGPRTAAARDEVRTRLRTALDAMDPTDREVLALRHFEQLTNGEAAAVLGIHERAAAQRYVRALHRLKRLLAQMPGGLTELRP